MTVKNYTVDRSANLQIDIAVSNSSGAALDLGDYTSNAYYKTHVEAANSVTITSAGYSNGTLRLTLTGVQTANVTVGRYMYEAYITHTSSNTSYRVQEGILTFTGGLS